MSTPAPTLPPVGCYQLSSLCCRQRSPYTSCGAWEAGGGGNAGREPSLRVTGDSHARILGLTSPTDSTHLSKGNGEVLRGPLNLGHDSTHTLGVQSHPQLQWEFQKWL